MIFLERNWRWLLRVSKHTLSLVIFIGHVYRIMDLDSSQLNESKRSIAGLTPAELFPADCWQQLDQITKILFLNIPAEKVVLLQAIVELYEGLAVVRTIDLRNSLVSVLTTNDTWPDLLALLDSLKSQLDWRPAPIPPSMDDEVHLGYQKKQQGAARESE